MESIIVDALGTLPQIVLLAWGCTLLLDMRHPRTFILLYTPTMLLAHLLQIYILNTQLFLKTLVILLLHFGLLLWFSRERIAKTVIIGALQQMTLIMAEVLSSVAWLLFAMPGRISDMFSQHDPQLLLLGKIVYLCCYVPLFSLMVMIFLRVWRRKDGTGFISSLIIFPCSQLFMASEVSILQFYNTTAPSSIYLTSVFNMLLCVGSTYFLTQEIKRIKAQHVLAQEALLKESQLQIQENYYRQLEENAHTVSKLRHDMNDQLQTAFALFDKGAAPLAEQLLSQVSQRLRETALHRFCEDSVVEAVMQEKARVCEQERISLDAVLNVQSGLPIAPMALCSLFSNALDNAIEGCRTLPPEERHIFCRSRVDQGHLTLCVQNPYHDGTTALPRGDRVHYGLGLPILRDLAAEYRGAIEITTDAGQFTLTAWLCVEGEKNDVSADALRG